jgi:nucleotide sugar dehydrogenase
MNGREYLLAEATDDREGIEGFLRRHPEKPVIAVQGLGFVGAVMSLVCANAHGEEYAVIGVDLPTEDAYWKIGSLNDGVFPLAAEDPKIMRYYKKSIEKGNFYATHDPYAYQKADVIIVDVNLDVLKRTSNRGELLGYEVDMSGFTSAVEMLGMNCKPDALILVETTVPPGTCQELIHPTITRCLAERGESMDDILIGHSYERVMPGPEYIDSIMDFPRVFSGVNEQSADATERFLKTIIHTDRYALTKLGSTNATEMAKVLENSYRAMNIAFVVEWSRFAEEAGVDLFEIVNAIRVRPTHANLMFPGIGVGGYCLTKDPLLASWARMNFFNSKEALSQSEKSVAINDKMPEYAYNHLCQVYGSGLKDVKVLLLGVSYRGDVSDTRYSPVELFHSCLVEAGALVSAHDPMVDYWAEKNEKIEGGLRSALEPNPAIVAITTGHSMYSDDDTIDAIMECKKALIYDTIGVLSEAQVKRLQTKHAVRVLGRGDLQAEGK